MEKTGILKGKGGRTMKSLNEFVKKNQYLICVDSDGCAMDTMDVKHIRCFGPCMVKEWGLEEWQEH